ncbi:MAG: LysM peptidoglycan-binding domain-containing protein [bacterium]|nr:LysM peptidoglycan-binding domain-containing protein [bacterium]
MNRHFVLRVGVFAGLLATFCGCDKGPSLSEIEARERTSRMYTNATDDLQAGRMDAAIKGFERVVLKEPESYSAHFQLATLLQDVRKDYIGAIAHYRSYLALRPASDKATVAQDRMKLCETLLNAEVLRKAGGSASGKLAADNEKLAAARDSLEAQVKKLETELERAKKDIARLESESASKSRLLQKLSEADDVRASKTSAVKEALAEIRTERDEAQRRHLKPTDAELLDEPDDGSATEDRIRTSQDVRKLKSELAAMDRDGRPQKLDVSSARLGQLDDGGPVPSRPDAGGAVRSAVEKSDSGQDASKAKKSGKPSSLDAVLGSATQKKPKATAGGKPETYTVQQGDTLFIISKRFYGAPNKWKAILNANRAMIAPDGRLRAGQVIKLP